MGPVVTKPLPPVGVPNAREQGKESEAAQKMGPVVTEPLPPGGSPTLQSGVRNQKWPTNGPAGNITPAAWGVPNASGRGDRIRTGPQMGPVVT